MSVKQLHTLADELLHLPDKLAAQDENRLVPRLPLDRLPPLTNNHFAAVELMRFTDFGMATLDCPCLRPGLALVQDHTDPRFVVLCDRLRLSGRPQRLTLRELAWLQFFDGRRNLRDIQIEAMRQEGGTLLPID